MKKEIEDYPIFPIVLPNDIDISKLKGDDFEEEDIIDNPASEETVEDEDENKSSQTSPEVDEEENDSEENADNLDETALVSHLNILKDLGYLKTEDEITLENAEEIYRKSEEIRTQESFNTIIESLSPQIRELVLFGLNGGDNLESFMELQRQEIALNYDLTDEDDQKKVVTKYLKSKGNEDFVIEAVLERLEDTNRLQQEAKIRLAQMKAEIESEKIKATKEQEIAIKNREKEIKEFQNQVFTVIKEQPLPENNKREIMELIYGSDKSTPYLQKVIDSIVSDPKLLVNFAKVVKQHFDPKEGFKINNKTESVVKDEFKKKLASSISKSGVAKSTGASSNVDWRNTNIAF